MGYRINPSGFLRGFRWRQFDGVGVLIQGGSKISSFELGVFEGLYPKG